MLAAILVPAVLSSCRNEPSSQEADPAEGSASIGGDLDPIAAALAKLIREHDTDIDDVISGPFLTEKSLHGRRYYSRRYKYWCIGEWGVVGTPQKCRAHWAQPSGCAEIFVKLVRRQGTYHVVDYDLARPGIW